MTNTISIELDDSMLKYFEREGLSPKDYLAAVYVNDPGQTSIPIILELIGGEDNKAVVPIDAQITIVITRRNH